MKHITGCSPIITGHNFPYLIHSSAVDCFIVTYLVFYFPFLQDAYLRVFQESEENQAVKLKSHYRKRKVEERGRTKEIYQPQGEDKNRKQCKNVQDFRNPTFYVMLTGKLNNCVCY